MFKRFLKLKIENVSLSRCYCNAEVAKIIRKRQTVEPPRELVDNKGEIDTSAILETILRDTPDTSKTLKPTFNFAAYVNKSETLQELVKLGVNLHKIEKTVSAIPYILGLKFEEIKGHLIFLKELGLNNEDLSYIISKNPYIFKEELENLQVRINYLESKKFTSEMILRIIQKNPFWLSYSTKDIDDRLGFFQKNFHLTGYEVRLVATKKPTLITYDLEKVKLNRFVVKEEMGFTDEEAKTVILRRPSIFIAGQVRLLKTFDYLHNQMKIPIERIAEIPEILSCRERRLKERHQFLVKLGKDQFDPKKPNYVGLTTLVAIADDEFATDVAKTSVQAYNMFLKTL